MKRCLLNPEMAAMGTYPICRCISMFNSTIHNEKVGPIDN
jgi:hypothetical protein